MGEDEDLFDEGVLSPPPRNSWILLLMLLIRDRRPVMSMGPGREGPGRARILRSADSRSRARIGLLWLRLLWLLRPESADSLELEI